MNDSSLAVRRFLTGALAVACLVASAGMWLFSAAPAESGFVSALTRIGIVLGALWLALPASGEFPKLNRASPALIVGGILFAIFAQRLRWYVFPLALAVAIAWAFLRPRVKR